MTLPDKNKKVSSIIIPTINVKSSEELTFLFDSLLDIIKPLFASSDSTTRIKSFIGKENVSFSSNQSRTKISSFVKVS